MPRLEGASHFSSITQSVYEELRQAACVGIDLRSTLREAATMSVDRRVAFAVVAHLRDQVERKAVPADAAESLDGKQVHVGWV